MAFSPVKVYCHDGAKLHPKLAYALPPGMGTKMVQLGLFQFVDATPDLDMSGLAWDEETTLAEALIPEDIVHPQGVA